MRSGFVCVQTLCRENWQIILKRGFAIPFDLFGLSDRLFTGADADDCVEYADEGRALVAPVRTDNDSRSDRKERMLHGALAGNADGLPAALGRFVVSDLEHADVGQAGNDGDLAVGT